MGKEPEEDPDMRNTTVRDQQENSDQEDVNSPQTDYIHNSNGKTQLPRLTRVIRAREIAQ